MRERPRRASVVAPLAVAVRRVVVLPELVVTAISSVMSTSRRGCESTNNMYDTRIKQREKRTQRLTQTATRIVVVVGGVAWNSHAPVTIY